MPKIFSKNQKIKLVEYGTPPNNQRADEWQLFRESLPEFILRFFPLNKK